MLTPWLQFGDTGLAFTRPSLVPLALVSVVILGLTLATWLRRRAAYREGALASTDALRLWSAGLLRAVATLAIVAGLAGATLVETEREDRLEVVALVDGSASIKPEEQEWMHSWLGDLVGGMRRDDELTVVRFGRSAVVESGPGRPVLDETASASVEGEATNLMAAIESGASLAANAGKAGVVVLLTDGNETTGDASAAAESARRHGVQVHAIVPPRSRAPLSIEHVTAPEVVRTGQEIELSVAIANRSGEAHETDLVVRHFDKELGRVPLRVAPGRSAVDAVVRAGPPGHYGVTVSLESSPDVASTRGVRHASLTVLGPPRLLLVSPTASLVGLLEEAGFQVERRRNLRDLDPADLDGFHAVVLGEVSSHDIPHAAQQALERYVRDSGGGLLVAAGRGLVADPTLDGSPFERLLPVEIKRQAPKKKIRQPLALFLVIDRSSSMTYGLQLNEMQPTRMAYARDAARELIDQLDDRDLVGAAAFDTETSLLSSLKSLQTNREDLTGMISRLVPSGGTDFKEALEIAARQLMTTETPTRHIILLTDGASIRPAAEHDAVTEALARAKVSVTSIRIGDDKDNVELIKKISERTGGTFYHVKDSTSLPDLMIHDTRRRAGRQEDEEQPTPAEVAVRPNVKREAQALGGLQTAELPVLRNFAAVPLKRGAEEWIGAEVAGKPAPILAAWQNGLGRVAIFTANPSHEWQSWGQVRRFWSQLIRWVARPESTDEIRLAVRSDGGRPLLQLDTFDRVEGGTLVVRVTDRDGTAHELRPSPLSPRHYEVALPPLDTIEPRIQVEVLRDGEVAFTRDEWLPQPATATRASSEDPESEPNWALLEQIAEITGGSVNAAYAKILTRAPAERQTTFPLAHWLTLGAFALLLVDIALRHTRWE